MLRVESDPGRGADIYILFSEQKRKWGGGAETTASHSALRVNESLQVTKTVRWSPRGAGSLQGNHAINRRRLVSMIPVSISEAISTTFPDLGIIDISLLKSSVLQFAEHNHS